MSDLRDNHGYDPEDQEFWKAVSEEKLDIVPYKNKGHLTQVLIGRPGVYKICPICGKKFRVNFSKRNISHCCSKECAYKRKWPGRPKTKKARKNYCRRTARERQRIREQRADVKAMKKAWWERNKDKADEYARKRRADPEKLNKMRIANQRSRFKKRCEGMSKALAQHGPLPLEEVEKLRAKITAGARAHIDDANAVIAGTKEWTPTQARVFQTMINKIIPDQKHIEHTSTNKRPQEMTREELELAAARIAAKYADAPEDDPTANVVDADFEIVSSEQQNADTEPGEGTP